MEIEETLFPPDYWTEAEELPPLRLVQHYAATGFSLMRYYIGQEGGLVARPIEFAEGSAAADLVLSAYERALAVALPAARHRAMAH